MKLYKALKLKKTLVGEIAKLKEEIKSKNSYLIGNQNAERFPIFDKYDELTEKTSQLIALKFVINEANAEIQSKIYLLGEYKSLTTFLNELSITEGTSQISQYGDKTGEFKVGMNETIRDTKVKEFQTKINALQEEIDIFNFTTEIPWGDNEEDVLDDINADEDTSKQAQIGIKILEELKKYKTNKSK